MIKKSFLFIIELNFQHDLLKLVFCNLRSFYLLPLATYFLFVTTSCVVAICQREVRIFCLSLLNTLFIYRTRAFCMSIANHSYQSVASRQARVRLRQQPQYFPS